MSTSVELALAEQGAERGWRRLSLVIGLGAVVLFLFSGLPSLLAFPAWAPWWTAGALAVCALLGVMLLGSMHAPLRMLMAVWVALPPLLIVLGFTSFAAYRGDDIAHVRIWVWSLESVALAAFTLVAPAGLAIAAAAVSALMPLVSALVFTGGVPAGVAVATPLHLANITLVLVLLALRGRLGELQRSEAAAQATALRQAQRDAENERQRALTRVVHDEVLAVFTAALQLGGAVPPELRREAASALAALDRADAESEQADRMLPAGAAAAVLAAEVRSEPGFVLDTRAGTGAVPAGAVQAIAAAAGEAARNSSRHAPAAPRRATIRASGAGIAVTIADDGPGFDPSAVDPARLGLRESIAGRMAALPGGTAEIVSAPGRGTEVRLRWHP